MSKLSEPLITEGEAAAMLRVSLTSLRRWRANGCGPVFRKMGKSVRYRPADLAEFVASARRTSTSGARGISGREAA
jgi:Helix-turn-helix domain